MTPRSRVEVLPWWCIDPIVKRVIGTKTGFQCAIAAYKQYKFINHGHIRHKDCGTVLAHVPSQVAKDWLPSQTCKEALTTNILLVEQGVQSMGAQFKSIFFFLSLMIFAPATLQADMAAKALSVSQIGEQIANDLDAVEQNHHYASSADLLSRFSAREGCSFLSRVQSRMARFNAAAAMLVRARRNINKEYSEALRLAGEIAVARDLFSMDTREASANVNSRLNRIRAQSFLESNLHLQIQQALSISQQDVSSLGQMFNQCNF